MYVSVRVKPDKNPEKQAAHDFRIDQNLTYVNRDQAKNNAKVFVSSRPIKSHIEDMKQVYEMNSYKNRKVRNDTSFFVSGVITFGGGFHEIQDSFDKEELDKAALELVRDFAKKHNTEACYLVRHEDESTTHYHFTVRNINMAGKTVASKLDVKALSKLQDLAGEKFEHLGFKRGVKKADKLAQAAEKIGEVAKDGKYSAKVWREANVINKSVKQLHETLHEDLQKKAVDMAVKEAEIALKDEEINKMGEALLDRARDVRRTRAKIEGEEIKLKREFSILRDDPHYKALADANRGAYANLVKAREFRQEIEKKPVDLDVKTDGDWFTLFLEFLRLVLKEKPRIENLIQAKQAAVRAEREAYLKQQETKANLAEYKESVLSPKPQAEVKKEAEKEAPTPVKKMNFFEAIDKANEIKAVKKELKLTDKFIGFLDNDDKVLRVESKHLKAISDFAKVFSYDEETEVLKRNDEAWAVLKNGALCLLENQNKADAVAEFAASADASLGLSRLVAQGLKEEVAEAKKQLIKAEFHGLTFRHSPTAEERAQRAQRAQERESSGMSM